jgi:hypothetical protein
MNSKIITAVFKGQNGSCRYNTNKRYALKVYRNSINGNIRIELAGKDDGIVEYGDITNFLSNWDSIRVMNQ